MQTSERPVTGGDGPNLAPRGHRRGALAVWALLIAYASLYPFAPLRPPGEDALAHFFRAKVFLEFDVATNALAYVPLGAFACLAAGAPQLAWPARLRVVLACALFSLAMEGCQFFIATRVASGMDVVANALGAFAGTLLFTGPIHRHATRRLARVRERLVVPGGWGDTGLILLALWLLAQLNPALPFFEAGNIGHDGGLGGARDFVVTASSVAMSVAGFGLFVSVMLRGPGGALRWTLLLLTVALWSKFAMASVMLKPHLSAEWVTEGRVAGLALGLAGFIPLREAHRAGRIYLALVLTAAGALVAKIFGAYSSLAELLRLFSWPYGQLATFATLTQWIHETWPLFAFAWLSAAFVWRRDEPLQ